MNYSNLNRQTREQGSGRDRDSQNERVWRYSAANIPIKGYSKPGARGGGICC